MNKKCRNGEQEHVHEQILCYLSFLFTSKLFSFDSRLFLLPHKDQRQMHFALNIDPAIKQGQTRYHYLVIYFDQL